MKMIILDLEMNQPSGRIIEIGAVSVNLKTAQILDQWQGYVRPLLENISPEITELTGISDDTINDFGIAPDAAFNMFWGWCEDQQCGMQFGAWGSDVWELRKQSQDCFVELPSKCRVLNLKEMAKFFRSTKGAKQKGGLKNALALYGLEFEGVQHRALDDAMNTAMLMLRFYDMIRKYEEIYKIMR